tara:strand:- start:294 stop:698 length:405 start_codon:yes stop_codon:yes gene_type:complete
MSEIPNEEKSKTDNKFGPDTYYFTTFDFELAYNVLDIQPNHVYKTDEKGIYHLLKSIIDCPDDFVNSEDGSCIFLDIDTDLKKIVEIAKENLLNTGFDYPEDFQLPKTETKEETKESPLEDLKKSINGKEGVTP